MSNAIPFPSDGSAADSSNGPVVPNMHIEIPLSDSPHPHNIPESSTAGTAGTAGTHRRAASHTHDRTSAGPSTTSAPNTALSHHPFHHHPRQPGPHAESYFPGGGPKTPGSVRGHSRNVSSTYGFVGSGPLTSHNMGLSLSGPGTAGPGATAGPQSAYGGFAGGGPPSPSTLTDVILGLHSTLYGSQKRSPEEVREMVWKYYEGDAIFENPLLSAHGREQIANQFIMAFALPGMDLYSELRDVICSDFEFDGTRAGIIDQTITVTFFPSLFGSDNLPAAQASGSGSSRMFSGDGTSMGYPLISSTTPHTPHPFLNYQTPGASSFSHADQSGFSQPHSPTTPFSLSSLWGSSSRPHTPGYAGNSAIRPFSSVPQSVYASNTPLSVNGEDFEGAEQRGGGALVNGASSSHFMTTEEAGGGQSTSSTSRPAMPAEALTPHWSAGGLGRGSLRGFIWGLLHPRAALRSLCSIQLRLLSRLEFNDAGKIVRHEDTWGLREAIEGIIPLAPIFYAIERRIVGFLTSWAVAKGFTLSNALLRKAIPGGPADRDVPYGGSAMAIQERASRDANDAHDAAYALLQRPHSSTYQQYDNYQTISRSRAPSPTRFRFGSMSMSANPSSGNGFVTGTRSRARSLVGAGTPSLRGASMFTDNIALWGANNGVWASNNNSGGAGMVTAGSGTGTGPNASAPLPPSAAPPSSASASTSALEFPPDSGAKYRDRTVKRLEGVRTHSTASAPASASAGPTVFSPEGLPTSVPMSNSGSNSSAGAGQGAAGAGGAGKDQAGFASDLLGLWDRDPNSSREKERESHGHGHGHGHGHHPHGHGHSGHAHGHAHAAAEREGRTRAPGQDAD